MNELEFQLLQVNDIDIPVLIQLHEEPSIKKYISVSENYFEYVTSAKNVWYYKILLSDIIIGGIHLEKDDDIIYLSICISSEYQGKGYGKKGLKFVVDKLSEGTNLIKVAIDEDNISSIKLFETSGFVFVDQEDELRNYVLCL